MAYDAVSGSVVTAISIPMCPPTDVPLKAVSKVSSTDANTLVIVCSSNIALHNAPITVVKADSLLYLQSLSIFYLIHNVSIL